MYISSHPSNCFSTIWNHFYNIGVYSTSKWENVKIEIKLTRNINIIASNDLSNKQKNKNKKNIASNDCIRAKINFHYLLMLCAEDLSYLRPEARKLCQ